MQIPLLVTKLHIPPLRPDFVSRRRWLDRLEAGLRRKLILISAPAGYGKTTLLSEWHASSRGRGLSLAWVLLDEQDNDPVRYGGAWVGGAVLIAMGAFLLLQNLTSFSLENWWALIILIPAANAFANSWRIYQSSKRLSAPARASLIGGILLTMVAAIFLFDLDWTVLGPVLIILAGLGLLINVILPG